MELINPQYPVYIISKGRWKNPLTAKVLDKMKVPYTLVVEPTEYDRYCETINSNKIIQLPFHDLNLGSVPARNFVWEHSISIGANKHWILDDNIEDFNRLNRNTKFRVRTGAIFKAAEDFVNRYENIALAGFNYYSFCKSTDKVPPFYLNTRIYSCILIDNKIPYRWRGIYNEDTDLSIRVLKDGYCTVLFNAFLCGKVTTMRMKGGNTDELYSGDGRLKMAQSLVEQHPDITKITYKFNIWQHQVNYKPFKINKLKLKAGIEIEDEINNYSMVIKSTKDTV